MPIFITSIWGAFLSIIGTVVGRVAVALGIGLISYIGFGSIIEEISSYGKEALVSLPEELKKILGLLRIGESFSLLTGTVTVKLIANGMKNGTIKRIGYNK